MNRCRQAWEDHSLTIVLVGVGVVFSLAVIPIPEGKVFDYILGLAHGCLTGALVNGLAGPFRERNRPET